MGKLVKRAELTILGTLGIVFLSYTQLPAFLSSVDESLITTTPATYTAAVGSATDTYIPPIETSAPTPVTVITVSSTSTDSASTVSDEIAPDSYSENPIINTGAVESSDSSTQ